MWPFHKNHPYHKHNLTINEMLWFDLANLCLMSSAMQHASVMSIWHFPQKVIYKLMKIIWILTWRWNNKSVSQASTVRAAHCWYCPSQCFFHTGFNKLPHCLTKPAVSPNLCQIQILCGNQGCCLKRRGNNTCDVLLQIRPSVSRNIYFWIIGLLIFNLYGFYS